MSNLRCPKQIFNLVVLLFAAGMMAACGRFQPAQNQVPVSTLRVVMDNNYPPYIFADENGALRGILIDQWKLWEQKTGVKVEITALPWNEALERMKAGEFDVIDTIFYTEERGQFFDFTKPYAKIDVRIFFKNNIAGIAEAEDLRGFRVAVKAGDANVDFLKERGITDLAFYNSYEEIVQAASANNVNIFVIDEPPALYFLYKYGIQAEINASDPLYGGEFHRAVSKGNLAVLKLVNDGFSRITAAEDQAIASHWFGVGHINILKKWTPYFIAAASVLSLLLLALFLLTRVLQQRVQERTAELREALENLRSSEAHFRSAIEFLPIPTSIADDQGNILLVNRKFTEQYGYRLEDIPTIEAWCLQAYPDQAYREQVLATWNEAVARSIQAGVSMPGCEYKVTCKDGQQCDVEITMYIEGNLWITSFNNVTSRKQTEEALRESEMIFSSFLEHSPVYVFFKDKDIRSIRLSKNYEQMLGMPVSEALGKTMDEIFPSDLAKSMVADDLRILNEGQRVEVVEELNERVYETTKFPIYKDGKPFMLAGFTMDITARKQAESALRESEGKLRQKNELLRSILESPKGIIIFSLDRDCRYTAFTISHQETMKAIWNVDIQIGINMLEAIPDEEDREKARQSFERAFQGEHFIQLEEYGKKSLRRSLWEDHYAPIYDEDNQIVGLTVFVIDISDRQRAEAALRESEQKYRSLFETMAQGVVYHASDGQIISANPAAERILGLSLDQMQGKKSVDPHWRAIHADGSDFPGETHPAVVALTTGKTVQNVVMGVFNPSIDDYCWININAVPQFKEGETHPYQVYATFEDLTERKHAEDELRGSLERNHAIVAALPDALFQIDSNHVFLDCIANDLSRLLLSPEDVIGQKISDILPPYLADLTAEKVEITLKTGEMQVYDYSLETNGQTLFFEGRMTPLNRTSVLVLVRDITESRHALEALEQNEKRFRTLLENSADALTLLNADGLVVYEGPTVERLTGYPSAERLGKNSLANIFPADLPFVRKVLGDILAAPGNFASAEFRSVKKDGSVWWTEATATNLLNDPHVQAIVVNYRDITRRKLAEEQLRESETRYRTLFERANDAIIVENTDDQIVDVNQRACEMLGYIREELLRMRVTDVIAPEIGRRKGAIEQEFAQYGSKPFESIDIRKDGSRLLVEVTNTILPNGLALSIVRDITERKHAENELRSSEKRFRILFESAGVGVAQGNSETRRFLKVNQKFADIFGYTRQEMENLDFAQITHPGDLPNNLDLLESLKNGEISEFTLEKRYLRKDGTLVWVLITVSPMWNPGDTPDTHITVAFDITAQKRAQEALRESENRFRTLFESAGVGVAQAETTTGQLLRVNQRYCEMVGYSREELESMTYQSITHPDDLQNDQAHMEKLVVGEISEFQIEKRYIRKDGTLVWVALVVSQLWQPGEAPSTHIGVIHDITEQKRAEYALRYSEAEVRKLNAELERRVTERTSQLEAANKELEAFAYSVSHDLRAPLRAIDGFSRILVAEHASQLNADALELIDRVRSANLNMTQLVDALLGLSRMTRAALHRESIDLSLLARKVIENLRQAHPDRNVEFSIAAEVFVEGDLRLLSIVLENLLGNAWKFTSKREKAQVEFGVEQRNGQQVYFVRDNGAGFNMAYADKLFGAFQRLHTTSQFEGTGIGLATVQRIIHRHGGKVWAESEVDRGAMFYFTLG